jgi:hypothetical protein
MSTRVKSTARVHKSRENFKLKFNELKSILDVNIAEDGSVIDSQRVMEAKSFMKLQEMRKVAHYEKKKKKRYEQSYPQFDIRTDLIPPHVISKCAYSDLLTFFQAELPMPTQPSSSADDMPSLLTEFDTEVKGGKKGGGKRSGRWFHSGNFDSEDEDSLVDVELLRRVKYVKIFLRLKLDSFLNMIWNRNDSRRHKVVHYTIILKMKGNNICM